MRSIPRDIQIIEYPEQQSDYPMEGFTLKRRTIAHGSRALVELWVNEQGKCLEVIRDELGSPLYRLFSSQRAWEIADKSIPEHDPLGGFFPGEYRRLRIRQPYNLCTCHRCKSRIAFRKAIYAHSARQGYLPFCESCFGREISV